jgi:hypothetical protein
MAWFMDWRIVSGRRGDGFLLIASSAEIPPYSIYGGNLRTIKTVIYQGRAHLHLSNRRQFSAAHHHRSNGKAIPSRLNHKTLYPN